MHASPFPTAPIAGARTILSDSDITVDYFVSEEAEVCVMHDRPFAKTLSWIEYDVANSRLDIIMEDGDIRNFGIPVDPRLKPYFMNTHVVHVIQLNIANKSAEGSVELPLIIHQG